MGAMKEGDWHKLLDKLRQYAAEAPSPAAAEEVVDWDREQQCGL